MPTIQLITIIEAPLQRVFDLSRSIDLHKASLAHTNEEAVAGVTTGLINLNETVTWRAKHLFKMRTFKSWISEMMPYSFFVDEMQEGDFKYVRHEHHFEMQGTGTMMTDKFRFESPYGLIGKLANLLFLKSYLTRLLQKRNSIIREYAENGKWIELLHLPETTATQT